MLPQKLSGTLPEQLAEVLEMLRVGEVLEQVNEMLLGMVGKVVPELGVPTGCSRHHYQPAPPIQ